mgnify:CR=1 FL=1
MINENEMVVTDSNGNEHSMKILFTYENEERKTSYVFLYEESDEENVMVFRYDESTHELSEIEDDEELSECEEVLNCYYDDPKFSEIK